MPIALKLSRHFYERLGDEIANELIEMFNSVEATYRSELREVNELHYARFDAKLEQRLAELRAALRGEMTSLEAAVQGSRAAVQVSLAEQREWIEKTLREQTRFFFLAWAVLLASNIALWMR